MDLKNALTSALEILETLKGKGKELDDRLVLVTSREEKVAAEDLRLKEQAARLEALEKTLGIQLELKKAQDQLHNDRIALEKAQADFETNMATVKQDIQERKAKLEEIRQEADQVRKDKLALVEEKKVYKDKIRKELADSLTPGKK